MNKVIYRELIKEDYETIKELIGEAFGFNKFIKDKELLDAVETLYIRKCISESSFSKVAVKDNRVIGIILGDSYKDKNRLEKYHNVSSDNDTKFESIMTNEENRKTIKEFSKISDIYEEIIKGRENDFQGCIKLFIVSKEARGHGVGKDLLNYLYDYMQSMDIKSIYLYTDTICNYGFYESQNFKRLNQKEVYVDLMKQEITVFLYGYNFK